MVGAAALFGENRVFSAFGLDRVDDEPLAGSIDIGDEVGDGALGMDLEFAFVVFALEPTGLARQALSEDFD